MMPQMPGQAPTMSGLFSAMQAKQGVQQPTPGIVDALVKRPYNELLQMYHNPPPGVPTYAIIAARDRQIKEEQLRKYKEIQEAQAKLAQQPRTVAEQVMGPVNAPQGGMEPVRAAQGGLMQVQRFQAGGSSTTKTQEQQDREKIISALSAAGFSAQKLAAAGFDIVSMPARALMGVYNTLVRGPRAFGLNLPFIGEDSPDFIASMTPAMDAVRRAEDAKKYAEYMDPNRPPTFGVPAPPAPLRGAPTAPRAAPAGTGAPAPLPASPPLVRLSSSTPPATARPPAATQPPPATPAAPGLASALPPGTPPFSIEEYLRQVRGAGNVPEDEKAAYEALQKARQAQLTRSAQQREEYGRSLDMTPQERRRAPIMAALGGARRAESVGDFFLGAAEGVGGFETKQREQQRQLRKELMTLEQAEENLRLAMLEKDLAYKSGKRERVVAAEIKASEALRDYQFKLASEAREEEKVKAEKDLRAAQKLAAEADLKRIQQGGGPSSRIDPSQVRAIQALLEEANKVANNQLAPEPARRAAAAQAARYEAQLARLGGMTVDTAPTGAGDVPPPGAVQRVR